MAGTELKSNLRCFTVISRLCCCCGELHWLWMGKGGLQWGWGWMCEWVGSRVGVGPFFCSLHFSPSPSREGMDRGSCHLTCECSEGGPGVFRKLSFFCPPPIPFFKQKQHGVSEPQSDPEEGLCWMRRGREWEKKPGEGKGGTLPPRCLVQEQPEQQQRWWECHRLPVKWNRLNLTSMWKLHLAGNCGSSTEPLEYIVSIWAHYPIGCINKEGIPLSQLPQQRRKGEEQSWWEEKWSKGRGGVHCEGRGGHCLPVSVGNGKAWVIRACVSVFRKCVCMCKWVYWIEVCGRSMHVYVWGVHVWDVGAGRPFKGCSNKAGFFFFSLLFEWWLRTGWIPLLRLFGSTVLQGKCG